VDYGNNIHLGGFSVATVGALAIGQLWIPLIAIAIVMSGAVFIRARFRRAKSATDA